MTQEIPETPEEKRPAIQLRDYFDDMIQKGFNEQDAGLGAQMCTDWLLVAEVHDGTGAVLRIVEAGQPAWRTMGLLKFALADAELDMLMLSQHEKDAE